MGFSPLETLPGEGLVLVVGCLRRVGQTTRPPRAAPFPVGKLGLLRLLDFRHDCVHFVGFLLDYAEHVGRVEVLAELLAGSDQFRVSLDRCLGVQVVIDQFSFAFFLLLFLFFFSSLFLSLQFLFLCLFQLVQNLLSSVPHPSVLRAPLRLHGCQLNRVVFRNCTQSVLPLLLRRREQPQHVVGSNRRIPEYEPVFGDVPSVGVRQQVRGGAAFFGGRALSSSPPVPDVVGSRAQ